MKPLEEQTFSDDFMFGWMILSYPGLAREMLECILHIKVGEITYSESQKTVESFANSKGVRFDFYAENSDRIIEVEMQVKPDKEILRRSRYYQSAMDMAQLGTGKHYNELKDTYVVFICLKDPRTNGLPVYTVHRVCEENASVDVSNGTHEVYLNASAWRREKDVALRSLLRYISTNEATDDLAQALDIRDSGAEKARGGNQNVLRDRLTRIYSAQRRHRMAKGAKPVANRPYGG